MYQGAKDLIPGDFSYKMARFFACSIVDRLGEK
jgi:hypothetical protein